MTFFFLVLILWIVLLIYRIPIFISLGLVSFIGLIFSGMPINSIAQKIINPLYSYSLLAVPLFIVSAEIMNRGGITEKIVNFSRESVGFITGGFAQVNIFANLIITGISGSALAEAAGIAKTLIPAMIKNGFNKAFSGSLTATASILGPLIPPSIPLVILSSIASISLGKLLLAAFLPGFFLALVLSVYVYFYSKQKKIKKLGLRPKKVLLSLKDGILAIVAPIIVIIGIVTGKFNATEAAVFLFLYCILVSKFVYKKLTLEDFKIAFLETSIMTSKILIIVAISGVFSYFVTLLGVVKNIINYIQYYSLGGSSFLIIVSILVIFLGCFLDGLAIMFLLAPILIPIANTMGIDLVHFGIIFTVAILIGNITPPFGPAVFIVSDVAKIQVELIFSKILPFFILLLFVQTNLIFFPNVSLFLPKLFLP